MCVLEELTRPNFFLLKFYLLVLNFVFCYCLLIMGLSAMHIVFVAKERMVILALFLREKNASRAVD